MGATFRTQRIFHSWLTWISALVDDAIEPIQAPQLTITIRTVEEALADARYLIASRGSMSGVDRVHTAFHGYLRILCEQADINVIEGADVSALLRALRSNHTSLQTDGPRSDDITHMLRALSSIVARLNTLRN